MPTLPLTSLSHTASGALGHHCWLYFKPVWSTFLCCLLPSGSISVNSSPGESFWCRLCTNSFCFYLLWLGRGKMTFARSNDHETLPYYLSSQFNNDYICFVGLIASVSMRQLHVIYIYMLYKPLYEYNKAGNSFLLPPLAYALVIDCRCVSTPISQPSSRGRHDSWTRWSPPQSLKHCGLFFKTGH